MTHQSSPRWLLFIAFNAIVICASAEPPTPPSAPVASGPRKFTGLAEGVDVDADLVYAKTPQGDLVLDLYRPAKIEHPAPVVVFVHGGGWKSGDKKSARKNAVWLVSDGFAVASINYRLLDQASWPAQINDCYEAVRWIRRNAEKYQLDPDRIVAWGGSAGGHLAALLGTRPCPEPETTSSRVQAVIDWFGPTDLLTMPPNVVNESRSFEQVSKSNGARLLGAAVMTVPELAKDASALHQVSADDCPVLIMHGDQDKGVPIDQSTRFHDALQKAGVDSRLHVVKGAGHGGAGFRNPSTRDVIRDFLRQLPW